MTTKQPWYKNIDWKAFSKGAAALVTACGLGVGFTSTTGIGTGNADEIANELALHQVTDSLRNVYMEEKLTRMEKNLNAVVELSTATHDAVIRLEARQ